MMWYVERAYPGESPWKGAALNGFMVTLLNLRGTAALLAGLPGSRRRRPGGGRSSATDLADKGARTLQRHLPDHDSGAWSYYGLLTPGRPWRTYLADLNYHCYHVRLLTQLAAPYPGLGFADTAARWQGYVDDAGLDLPGARPSVSAGPSAGRWGATRRRRAGVGIALGVERVADRLEGHALGRAARGCASATAGRRRRRAPGAARQGAPGAW